MKTTIINKLIKIKRFIINKLIMILENFLKKFWMILIRRLLVSVISVWFMQANTQYVTDIILHMSDVEKVILGLSGFSFLYLCWRRWGIYNFKKDYNNKEQQQQLRETDILNKLEELGVSTSNKDLNKISEVMNLQEEIKSSGYLSKHFKPAYFKLENATGSKRSLVNMNEMDYYVLKDKELSILKSLIKYRQSLFTTECCYSGFFMGAFWIIMKLVEESNEGGDDVVVIKPQYLPKNKK